MHRRWRSYPLRRGEFFQVVPTAPTPPPAFTDQSLRRRTYASRRGAFYGPSGLVAPGPVPTPARRKAPLAAVRRGRFWHVVPAQVVVSPPPAWPPAPVQRIRVRLPVVRRGEFFYVPLVGQAPQPPVLIWPPTFIRQRQQSARPVRRGQFTPVPVRVRSVPSRIASRRPPGLPTRRGEFFQPPWRFIPPGQPGPLVGRLTIQSRRPPVRPLRRARYFQPPWPSLAHVCTTPRPNDGTTARPSSGTTARPGAGTTARPNGGITARPDMGMTERPC